MSYIDPKLVQSPKGRLSNLTVITDTGADSYSIAILTWDGKQVVGARWNGSGGNLQLASMGNPQSRGVPTWFILPDDVALPYLKSLLAKGLSNVVLPVVQEYLETH